jgi:hypothetical protein
LLFDRFREYQTGTAESLEKLQSVRDELFTLCQSFETIQERLEMINVSPDITSQITGTMYLCRGRVINLDAVLKGLIPSDTNSTRWRLLKGVKSFIDEKKIDALLKQIRSDGFNDSIPSHRTQPT